MSKVKIAYGKQDGNVFLFNLSINDSNVLFFLSGGEGVGKYRNSHSDLKPVQTVYQAIT